MTLYIGDYLGKKKKNCNWCWDDLMRQVAIVKKLPKVIRDNIKQRSRGKSYSCVVKTFTIPVSTIRLITSIWKFHNALGQVRHTICQKSLPD